MPEEYRLPGVVRVLSAVGDVVGGLGVKVDLSAEALHKAARRATGLDDFGGDYYLEALHQLLRALEEEAGLSSFGRFVLKRQLVGSLTNRLLVQDELRRHPEISGVRIERPIFVLGFPRTGTTLLHRLLCFLPGVRLPLFWELLWPSLPLKLQGRKVDPRIARAEKVIRDLLFLSPHLKSIHPYYAQGPEECFHLLENSFMCGSYGFYCRVPKYMNWLIASDMKPAYQYYKKQLQLLQYKRPGSPWILKWPGHLVNVEALFSTFPDACVVQTHRNLLAVAPSSCSFCATLRMLYASGVELKALGEEWMRGSTFLVERSMAARERLAQEQFFDLRYDDLTADPIGAVRRICKRFQLPLTAAVEAAMRRHLAENPAEKHGAHRYSLGQFGLRGEEIERQFKGYHERFGVGSPLPGANCDR